MNKSKMLFLAALSIALLARAEDINRTLRFRSGGAITMDTTASIADEDGNWTLSSSTLKSLAGQSATTFSGGVTDTNSTTGSYTLIRAGWFVASNAVTGSFLYYTNGSLLISNAVTGKYLLSTNGTVTATGTTNFLSGNLQIGGTYYGNASQQTNNVSTQAANYPITIADSYILLSAAHSATLPTAVGIPGKVFTILCTGNGTNAILTTSAQTINGATSWTNTAQYKFTSVVSDNANWWVTGQN